MKKTITVSLGRSVFNLEDDAYNVLNGYLKRLEYHFAKEEGKQEILADIESRIAEHLREGIRTEGQVIGLEEVQRVIRIMGDPGEISGDDNEKGSYSTNYQSFRRLYRDVDDRILGGICSGMGHYWRIEPLLFRILFFITLFWGGLGLLTYIILWIVIPPAITTSQKLEMRGEAANADNIGRSFSEQR